MSDKHEQEFVFSKETETGPVKVFLRYKEISQKNIDVCPVRITTNKIHVFDNNRDVREGMKGRSLARFNRLYDEAKHALKCQLYGDIPPWE